MQKRTGTGRTAAKGKKRRVTLGKRERRRLIQFAVCLGLFLVVLLGKGRMPHEILHYVKTDADFRGAFSALGEAIAGGTPVTQALGDLVIEVFGAGGIELPDKQESVQQTIGEIAVPAVMLPTQLPTQASMLAILGVDKEDERDQAELSNVNTVVTSEMQEYGGSETPEKSHAEYNDLGLAQIVTPVMGEVTSEYGYRLHPVNDEYTFHSGVDLAVDAGTPIMAFADGNVEYIGESEAYGLYVQLDHGNEVKTFYCHCQDLYVQKGERVLAGETIAAVGESGNATGPHLHLELKQNDVFLDPLSYIETIKTAG